MASRKLIRLINYNMKTYNKNQYSGNINKWGDDFKTLSQHDMPDNIANELNKQFDATGVKYEEVKEEKKEPEAKPTEPA